MGAEQNEMNLDVPVQEPEIQHDPSCDWLNIISNNRPEVFLLLHAMLIKVIRDGKVTAEDFHHIPVSHPNCRGAAMKYLRRCGCRPMDFTYGSTQQSHSHVMMIWVCLNKSAARHVLKQFDIRRKSI